MRIPTSALLLVLSLAVGGATGAQTAASAAPTIDELGTRNLRVSFSAGAGERARHFLGPENSAVAANASPLERGAALVALGAGGDHRDVPLLESYAVAGPLLERRAAAFGLGELGAAGLPALQRLLVADVTDFEQALTLALVLANWTGSEEAGDILRRLASAESGPLQRSANRFARILAGDPKLPRYPEIALYFELRWIAACEYGFVDGRRWREVRSAELLADDEFLDRVILRAATMLGDPTVRDHVVEMVRRPPGRGRRARLGVLRGVVAAHTETFGWLFETGGWRPRTLGEWATILLEIENLGVEKPFAALIREALEAQPELVDLARRMLVRAGDPVDPEWVDARVAAGDVPAVLATLEAAADAGDPGAIPRLEELAGALDDPLARATCDVALARLGHVPSREALQRLLAGPPSAERVLALAALNRAMHDPVVAAWMKKVVKTPKLSAVERACVLVAYARLGQTPDRDALHEWVRAGVGTPEYLKVAVRALARKPDFADLQRLETAFPLIASDDPLLLDANVDLAVALVRGRTETGKAILRSALWGDAWNRSVLAGGLLIAIAGPHALEFELDSPAPKASEADLRRVGFAIGEWGGLPAVDALARERDERDPALQGAMLGALSARGRVEGSQ